MWGTLLVNSVSKAQGSMIWWEWFGRDSATTHKRKRKYRRFEGNGTNLSTSETSLTNSATPTKMVARYSLMELSADSKISTVYCMIMLIPENCNEAKISEWAVGFNTRAQRIFPTFTTVFTELLWEVKFNDRAYGIHVLRLIAYCVTHSALGFGKESLPQNKIFSL